MRTTTVLVIALMCLCVCGTSVVQAGTPFVAVYFDEGLTQEHKDCPGFGVRDTLYVAASNFDVFLGALAFQVFYPPSIVGSGGPGTDPEDFNILGEADGGVVLGTSATGISIGFPLPELFNVTRLVLQVDFYWNCNGCATPNEQIQVCCVEGSKHPGFELVPGIGLTALVCATVPTEESTWSRVKALYDGDE